MRPTLSLIRREFTAYFLSPIAYVVLAVFLVVTGHLFFLTLSLLTESGPRGIEFPMQKILGDEKFWLVFLFIPPLLTMRLFAEERGAGTLEMLMTAPIRDWQVVMAKYVACFLFYLVLWLPTLVYWPVLTGFQSVSFDWRFTHASTPVLIAACAGMGIFFVNVAPLPAGFRLLCLIILAVAPAAIFVWGYDVNVVPNFLNFAPDQKASVLAAQGGIMLAAFLVLFLFPFALARLWGEPFEIAVLVVGWIQFLLALVYVVAHLLRTHHEGIFEPIHLVTTIDPRPMLVSYLGVILAGGMFLALGLFVSSLVRSQMVAALISLIMSLFFIAGFWRPDSVSEGPLYQLIFYVSVPLHFSRDFTRGILNTGHCVLYVTVTFFFLFMTVRSLESRRWK